MIKFNLTSVIEKKDVVHDLENIRDIWWYTALTSIPFFFSPVTAPIWIWIAAWAGGTSIVAWWIESYISGDPTPVITEIGSVAIWGGVSYGLKWVWVLSKVEFNTDAMRYMWHYADGAYGFLSTKASRIGVGIAQWVEQITGFLAGQTSN